MSTTLRERCVEFLNQLRRDAITRTGSAPDDLVAFVISERGRSSDDRLEATFPICLYFGSDADREEFMAIVREVKPEMFVKKVP